MIIVIKIPIKIPACARFKIQATKTRTTIEQRLVNAKTHDDFQPPWTFPVLPRARQLWNASGPGEKRIKTYRCVVYSQEVSNRETKGRRKRDDPSVKKKEKGSWITSFGCRYIPRFFFSFLFPLLGNTGRHSERLLRGHNCNTVETMLRTSWRSIRDIVMRGYSSHSVSDILKLELAFRVGWSNLPCVVGLGHVTTDM